MAEDQNLPAEGEEAVDDVLSWVPEKFRANPEKLAEAYTELERSYHNSRQEVKGLEDSIQTLSSQFEDFTAAQNRPDPNTVYSQWQERFDADPVSTMAEIAQATAQQIYAQQQSSAPQQPGASPDVVAFIADQTMGQTYDDWAEYKGRVAEVLKENPLFQRDELWTSPQSAQQALDSAYQMEKAKDVLSGNAVVQQQVADTRQMKLNAQTAVGASGRPPAPGDVDEWAAIKAAAPKSYWE